MRLFGNGLLMTFTEVAPENLADYDEWYNREHLDERIDLPGFRRARRYQGIDSQIKYLSTYECLEPEAIGSPRYLEVLKNQTAWSRRVMGQFVKWHRMSCRIVTDQTHGMGTYLTLARFIGKPEAAKEAARWLTETAVPPIVTSAGVVGAAAVVVDQEVDARLSRGLGQTPDMSKPPEWGVLVEGSALEPTLAASKKHLTRLSEFAVPGTTPSFETWQMVFANQRLSDNEKA